jgi:hypothetical protein
MKRLSVVLLILLVLQVLFLAPGLAVEEEQICVLTAGSKVLQITPDGNMKGVIVVEDINITIGSRITHKLSVTLNAMPMNSNMDWTEAHLGVIEINFGTGPVALTLYVRDSDMEGCK